MNLEAEKLEELLERKDKVITVDISGQRLELNRFETSKLCELLLLFTKKKRVSILAEDDMLSTSRAAEILQVSRPFIINLIDSGKLPGFKTGKHRRVRFIDLMKYKNESKIKAQRAMQKLHDLSDEMGMYDGEVKK